MDKYLIISLILILIIGVIIEIRFRRIIAKTSFKIREQLKHAHTPDTDFILHVLHFKRNMYANDIKKHYNKNFHSDLLTDLKPHISKSDALDLEKIFFWNE